MSDRSDSELPRRLGRYLVVEHLASGGMGAVYLALQQMRLGSVDRVCVLKTVRAKFTQNEDVLARFVDEARTSLLLSHKNVGTVLDVEEADGLILLAMEHIAGSSLREIYARVSEDRSLASAAELAHLVIDALDGLDYCHDATHPKSGQRLGLVHRDLSPHNVMVSFAGDVKVIDFGVARSGVQTVQTSAGAVVGKVRYMAPEQLSDAPLDRRADVFAMGIVLTELLARQRFYGSATDEQVWAALSPLARAQRWASAVLDDVPEPLQAIAERAVAYEPAERFASAGAFRDALVAAVGPPAPSSSKRLMARLFPGAEAAWGDKQRALYRAAEDVGGRTSLSEATTQRRSAPIEPTLVTPPSFTTDIDERAAVDAERHPADRATEDRIDEIAAVEGTAAHDAAVSLLSPPNALDVTTRSTIAPGDTLRTPPAPAHVARMPRRAFVALVAVLAVVALAFSARAFFARRDTLALAPSHHADPPPTIDAHVDAAAAPEAPHVDAAAPDTPRVAPGEPDPEPDVAPSHPSKLVRSAQQQPKPKLDALPPRPERLGERVRYLAEHCRARTSCATALADRGKDLGALSAEAIASFTGDVVNCLDRCGAP